MKYRELKFRDFDLETKKIRYFNLDSYDRYEHDSYGNTTQFTGVKDKDRKEIYEGDILAFEEYPEETVVFENGAFGYHNIFGDFITLAETNLAIAEVIGNIYEI